MNRILHRAFVIACMLALSVSVPTAAQAVGSPSCMSIEEPSTAPSARVASVDGDENDDGASLLRASQAFGKPLSTIELNVSAEGDMPDVGTQIDTIGSDMGNDEADAAIAPATQYETDTIIFVDSSRIDNLDRSPQKPSFSLRSFFGSGSHAYRSQLDEAQDAVYARLSAVAPSAESFVVTFPQPVQVAVSTAIPLSASDKALIRDRMSAVTQSAVDAVLYDCPEIFWLKLGEGGCSSSYAYFVANVGGQYVATIESLTYNVVLEMADVAARKAQVDAKVAAFPVAGTSVYDKVKSIHDELARTVTYASGDLSVRSYHNVIGPLLDGLCVCEGYAKAFKLICDREGIPCVLVSGMGITGSGSEPHMWNYVKIGDVWYAVDVTWDDQTTPQAPNLILYDYFLAGSTTPQVNFPPKGAVFSSTHQVDGDLSGTGIKMFQFPPLSATAYEHKANEPLTITIQPNGITVTTPDAAAFEVAASGGEGSLTYLWEANDGGGWKPIEGATAALLTIPATTPTMNGRKLRCVISDGVASIISGEVVLTVQAQVVTPTPTPILTPTPKPDNPTPTSSSEPTPNGWTPTPDASTPTPHTPTPTTSTPTPTTTINPPPTNADVISRSPTSEAATPSPATPSPYPVDSHTPPAATPTATSTAMPSTNAPDATPAPSQPQATPAPSPTSPGWSFRPFASSIWPRATWIQALTTIPTIQSQMREVSGECIELSVTVVPNATYQWQKVDASGSYASIPGADQSVYLVPKGTSGMYRVVITPARGPSIMQVFVLSGSPVARLSKTMPSGQIVRPIKDAAKTSDRPMHYALARRAIRVYGKPSLTGATRVRLLAGDCVVIFGKWDGAYRVMARGRIGYISTAAVTLSLDDAAKNGQIMQTHLTWSVGNCVGLYELANIRVSPDMESEKAFDRLPLGADVLVLGETDDFYQVLYGERIGYVRKAALVLRIID